MKGSAPSILVVRNRTGILLTQHSSLALSAAVLIGYKYFIRYTGNTLGAYEYRLPASGIFPVYLLKPWVNLYLLPSQYKGGTGRWSSDDCKKTKTSGGRTVCDCSQLGHFGLLFVCISYYVYIL